jgi:hypothetical protein
VALLPRDRLREGVRVLRRARERRVHGGLLVRREHLERERRPLAGGEDGPEEAGLEEVVIDVVVDLPEQDEVGTAIMMILSSC